VTSLVVAVIVGIAGATVLGVRDLPLPAADELAGQVARNALLAALLGAFGVAVGALIRNQLAAIVALFTLAFVVEPVVLALKPGIGRFGPTGALAVAAAGLPAESAGLPEDVDLVSVPLAVLALVTWIAIAFAASALLLQTRDLE